MVRTRALGLIVTLFAADACAQPGSYTTEKIAALGAQIAADVHRETKPVANDRIQAYVDAVGQRLSSAAAGPFPWRFEVVTGLLYNNVTREPLSVPGGYIFVPAELITAAESEDEFAGMLAHAMGHPFPSFQQMQGANVPLIFVGAWRGNIFPQGCCRNKGRWNLLRTPKLSA